MNRKAAAFLLSLCCLSGLCPARAAQQIDIGETYTAEATAEDSAAPKRESGGVRTAAAAEGTTARFGDQLSDIETASRTYEELAGAFDSESYTFEDDRIVITYSTPDSPVVGTTENYQLTANQINAMLAGYQCSVRSAYIAYRRDNPDIFFLGSEITQTEQLTGMMKDGRYEWRVSSVTLKLQSLVSSNGGRNNARKRYTAALEEAVEYAGAGSSRYYQLRRAHDYLCRKVSYGYGSYQYVYSAYGALVGTSCVCEGYANAFKAICDRLDIPCMCVSGEGISESGSESHMWNLVQMENGKWYAVDATWDDRKSSAEHTFFLVGRNTKAAVGSKTRTFAWTHRSTGTFFTDAMVLEFFYPEQSGSRYIKTSAVELDKTASVTVGHAVALTGTVSPSNATDAALRWSSSDESVATVSEGTVTGAAAGEAVITARTADGKTARCTVTVRYVPLTGISLADTSVMLGRTLSLSAALQPADAAPEALTWSSSAPEIAAVDPSGTVFGLAEGTADIRAETAGGLSATATVMVTPQLNTPALTDVTNKRTGVRIRWQAVDRAEGYCICRRTGNSWKGTQLAELSGGDVTSYVDQTAKSGTAYVYTVYALYHGVKSSDFDRDGLPVTYLSAPRLTKISNANAGVRIRWSTVDGAQSYWVYRKQKESDGWTRIAKLTGADTAMYVDTGVRKGKTYWYTVRACAGESRSTYPAGTLTIKRDR